MVRFIPVLVGLVILVAAVSWPRSELTSKALIEGIYASSGQFDPLAKKGVWFNKDVPVPGDQLARIFDQKAVGVLGESNEEKWIDVDLDTQRLRAYEGSRVVYDFPVSTGLPWFPTITGNFHIWAKVRSQRMTGGDVAAGTFYDLPNVPFVQYFYKAYGLHGAYWHNDFGKPRSHGCVNISVPNAEKLFYWTEPVLPEGTYARTDIRPSEGTRVSVHGTTPTNIN